MKKHIWIPVLILVLLIAAAAVFFFVRRPAVSDSGESADSASTSTQTVTSETGLDAADQNGAAIYYKNEWYVPKTSVESILFMGIDEYSDNIDVEEDAVINMYQNDYNLLLILDHETDEVHAIQLNRDTMCDIMVIGDNNETLSKKQAQLALAHTYGTGGKDSCANVRKAVERLLFGINIDYYAAISMDGVGIINDSVGGVTVTIPIDMTSVDPAFVKDKKVTLKGDQALSFVRARMSVGDGTNIARMERQSQYMLALWKKLKETANGSTTYLANLVTDLGDTLTTDCSSTQMQELFDAMSELDLDDIENLEGESVQGEEYMEFYLDDDAAMDRVIELYYDKKE